uniref:Venom protein n=1 Tax=Scolopendra viridis TaxID=118503 RepID=A0A4D5R8X7_SCOVI
MQLLLTLFVFVSVTATSVAFVCPPNACKQAKCPKILNCESGRVIPEGGVCGCCPTCITFADEGEPCVSIRMGTPNSRECKPGTRCNFIKNVCESINDISP